jgi:hypothetical protein
MQYGSWGGFPEWKPPVTVFENIVPGVNVLVLDKWRDNRTLQPSPVVHHRRW